MAEILYKAGIRKIAASPHYGEGSAGDVPIEVATERRKELNQALVESGIDIEILPNAEHHLRPSLFDRIDAGAVVPIGGKGKWLLVELPWQPIPNPEEIIFRIQMKGYRVILAHPERYKYIEPHTVERFVERGILMQLELGSFADLYGRRARKRAIRYADNGQCHVLASDLHFPRDAEKWIAKSSKYVRKRYGDDGFMRMFSENPTLLTNNADHFDVVPLKR
ncbi:MAG: hypothetical protein HOK97_01845 [Deltaproteobacteria bacterium]|nr:hypothetical protein [Deltaproteobacteria bacterium]